MSTDINIKKRIDIQEEGVSITPDVNSINFTGAGVTASAVGQDVTVDITAAAGSVIYYLNQTVAQAPYQEFSSTGTAAAEQIVPATVAGGATTTIASFQTSSVVPNTTVIPQGLWQFFLHFNATTAGQNWIIRPYVYKRDLGGIETLIFTPDPEVVTNMSTTTTMYTCDGVIPNTTLLTTDRIVVKIDIENTTGVSQTVNFRTEGSQHYSVAATTLNQAISGGSVTSVTGTAPVASSGGTTPAISMAQANGTTDGYLDSADWTTFNGKVPSTRDITINGTTQDLSADRTWNVGTVTSAGITAGTGISLAGTNPITSSGSITVTNSAPDQTVVLNNGTGINITGTYPNFTIANTAPDQTVALTAGSGIGVTGTYPNFTISNTDPTTGVTLASSGGANSLVNDGTGPSLAVKGLTAGSGILIGSTATAISITNSNPDQTVVLNSGTGINVTGTYPNFTVSNTGALSDVNIYNSDGTLLGTRVVGLNANAIAFQDPTGNGQFGINIDNGTTKIADFVVNGTFSNLAVGDNAGNEGSLFIDTNQARLKVVSSGGTVSRSIEAKPAGIEVNSTYRLPNTDGTSGQVVTTDGAGNLSFTTISSSTPFIPPVESTEIRRGFIAVAGLSSYGNFGGVSSILTGSAVAVTFGGTTRLPKLRLLTSTGSTNSVVGIATSGSVQMVNTLSFGFRFIGSYIFTDQSSGGTEWFVPNARQFCGLASVSTLVGISSVVSVDSIPNIIGMGSDPTDTNMQIVHNDATGFATKIDLGINFPANKTGAVPNGIGYQLELYAPYGATSVKYRVTKLSDNTSVTGTISTNLPASTTALGPQVVRTSGATSQNVSIDVIQLTASTLY